jgi:DNA-binding NtrC family response regulator
MISVVYVDDDPNIARVVSLLCNRCGGVTVRPFHSAEEAMRWITRNPVDVIVSDFTMPGTNGIELLKALRMQGIKAPFIIFSGKGIDEIMQESTNSGVDVFECCSKNDDIKSHIPNLVELIAKAAASSSEDSVYRPKVRNAK